MIRLAMATVHLERSGWHNSTLISSTDFYNHYDDFDVSTQLEGSARRYIVNRSLQILCFPKDDHNVCHIPSEQILCNTKLTGDHCRTTTTSTSSSSSSSSSASSNLASSTESLLPYPSPTGCAGLAALGGDGATYVTTNGIAYQLYCGIVPLPIFYNARSGDASIINCLSSCDLDPECGAAYFINEICYYSETPESYQAGDPETILAIRASSPDLYPDLSSSSSSSSSSSVEVPPVYPVTTT